ncbi:amino acid adenylation domain-containing protein [Flavobacterium sp. ZT3R18]|uniref:non-ribosomal peptide synthetase n=1 Tax=Flavobacterium sp. ZT3R18 TaxID=2594429 RepID=UPI001179E29B|nr:non-ribosomal peptide synthetase [Flavobacterium sp. ZT3R18]TRX33012.1 amino acid adenylation domain-containing protein [Flavobacterium sp. ZT3R18]
MQLLLKKINKLNIKIDLLDDKLDIQAPKGVITDDLLNEIKLHKNDLIKFIKSYKANRKDSVNIPKVREQISYELSSSQRRLWLLSQFEGGNVAYNMPSVFELYGDLDISSLRKAFQFLLERHESLRTLFKEEEESGQVKQIILNLEETKFQLQYEDLSNEANITERVKEIIQKEIEYSFDLSVDSLLRAKLIKRSQNNHVFICVIHHIVSDGWSSEIMTNEIFTLYDIYSKGKTNTLPVLKLQYKDYAAWQQNQLKSDTVEVYRNYWLKKMQGEIPVLDLPCYQARPAIKTYNGKSVKKLYSKELLKSFNDLCQSQECTLFMGLLATVKVLLFRYSNQKDIVIGSPIVGREHIDLQNQIGFYVNTLAFRTQFGGIDSFKELIANVKEVTLDAYEHQIFPFDELVQLLSLNRDMSRNPLFDVMVRVQDTSVFKGDVQKMSEFEITKYQCEDTKFSKFDLEFAFREVDKKLSIELIFNTDIYSEEFVANILIHLETLLHSIVENPESALNSLNYISEFEKKRIVSLFNDTKVHYSKDKTIVDLFEEQVEKTPNNISVVFGKTELTYQELNNRSNQLSYYLRENYAIQQDDLVGIKLEKSEKLIVTILGVLKAGGAYVPIDPNYPQNRIDIIENDSNCKVIIDEAELAIFNENKEKFSFENNSVSIKNNSLVYLIYTSGSTGGPKGIMMEHSCMLNLITFHNEQFTSDDVHKVLQFTSISFDVSFQEIFTTLLRGATLYPITEIVKKDSEELSAFIKSNNIDTVFLPTAYFNILMDVRSFYSLLDFNIIKNIIVAGEQLILTSNVINKIRKSDTNIYNHYGPAETHVVTTIKVKDNYLTHNPSIGCPISNTQIYILDEALQPVPIGVTGKLYISGAGVSRGYLNRPDLTKEKFINNPFIEGARMYDTGDLGGWLSDGNIQFLGRKDHQVKIRGFRIELGEIENAILQYSAGLKQVIVEVKESGQDKVLVAYLVSDLIVDKLGLRSFLQDKLPEYMIPNFYVNLGKLPTTPNGKIDRKALPSISGEDIIRKEYIAPRNKTEGSLVLIWQEVLGIKMIGITDNFFELGGHSLIVAQVINRTNKQLGKTVSFKVFFANPTIEGLSKELRDSAYLSIPQAAESESYPLTASQGRLWVLSQLEGGSLAYNMPAAVRLRGTVDINKFEASFKRLIHRHEILRTYFKTNEAGEIRQYIVPSEIFNFKITEKDCSLELNQEKFIANYLQETNNEPFDLEQGPLVRASILKLKEGDYVFFLSLHHIIGDGWSIELLISEIVKTYNALIQGKKINLPELCIQYKDYAVWLNEEIQRKKHKGSEEYWLQQFEGELPVLDLPSFKPRPLIQTYNGDHLRHKFSKSFLDKLKYFSKKQDVTLFMILMAGVNALLYRYSGQDDIIIGTPIAGREHPDLENQLGLYLNTLAIRTQFKEQFSLLDLVLAQKEALLGAYEHQGYPFDSLVGKLNLKRDMSRSVLFDVLIILQNQGQLNNLNTEELDNLELSDYDLQSKTSKFDISFIFVETEGLDLIIEYNTDIYDAYLIERMFTHFENLLIQSLAEPRIQIQEIDYLTETEKHQLLFEFNDTEVDYAKDKTIIDLFEQQVARTPDKVAIVFEETQLTYRELNEMSNQLAFYLREIYGIIASNLVGIKLDRSERMIAVLLGILKSGAAYVPIDPNYPQERIAYIEEDSNTKVVIDEQELGRFVKVQEKYSRENIEKINQPNDLAYVIYTSGTTGNPKGVMIEHKNVVNFLHGMNDSISSNEKEHLLAITSISFDISVLELFWTLTKGSTITLKSGNTPLNNFNLFLKDHSETLDFSLFYFSSQNDSDDNKYQFLKESADYADKNNFSAIWLPERHFHEFGGIFPNPSVLAAGLSTITENIQIRSGSVVLPLHDVVRVAEEWSVVDNLSNGRVALSIASGWHADDFVLKPENYLDRQKIMYGQIEELKTLWQGGSIKRKNGLNQEIDFKIYPKPVNSNLDIYITSGGNPETFRSAGKIGANILTHLLGQEIKDLANNIKIYKQALVENGFSVENAKISLMLHTYIGTDLEEVKDKAKEPFKSYLKSSVGLIQNLAKDLDKDISTISENDLNDLLELAFERYWQTSALLGTQDSCKKILSNIHSIGVTEIACLIDFGISDKEVLKGLEHLTELKNKYKKEEKNYHSDNHPISSMQITPSYLEALLEDDNSGLFIKSLKNIIVGGEKFSNELLNKLITRTKSNVYNMYGPTETTIWSTFQKAQENLVLNIGKPIQNTQVYILDNNEKICPIGVKGELCIGGDGLARGYYKQEKLTQDKFIDFQYSSTLTKKVYKTGDVARWLPNGTLEHLGRLDNQVKINGFRIELGEIENKLLKHEYVNQVVVTAAQKEGGNNILVAYFISNNKIKSAELKEYIELKLPHYMVPNHFIQLEEFPLTPNGKIDRIKLPGISDEDTIRKEYAAPRNETENKLIAIWQDVLGIEKIGVKDNFFDLGGNSLLMIKMLNSLNKELQMNITLLQGYNFANIFSISEFIISNTNNDYLIEEDKIEELYNIMEESYNLLNFANED